MCDMGEIGDVYVPTCSNPIARLTSLFLILLKHWRRLELHIQLGLVGMIPHVDRDASQLVLLCLVPSVPLRLEEALPRCREKAGEMLLAQLYQLLGHLFGLHPAIALLAERVWDDLEVFEEDVDVRVLPRLGRVPFLYETSGDPMPTIA